MQDNNDIKILVVDDDENNLFCATRNLQRYIGFPNFVSADDGTTALAYLKEHRDVDIMLLDRMMKQLNGIPTLKTMQAERHYPNLEIIFQTGEVAIEDKRECLEHGTMYMLQKPYDQNEMAVLIRMLAHYVRAKRRIRQKMVELTGTPQQEMTFRTLGEAEEVSAQLASHFPDPLAVYEAIYAVLANAVEHGNLGIGYETKRDLLIQGTYEQEVATRLAAPEYKDKTVTASVRQENGKWLLTVRDQGKGLRLEEFPTFGPSNLREPNGRGLYIANKIFQKVESDGQGTVSCWV